MPPPPWAFAKKGKGKGKRKPPAPKLAGNLALDDFRRFSEPLKQLDMALVTSIIHSDPDLQAFVCTIPKYAGKSLLDMFAECRSVIDSAIFFHLQGKANSHQEALAIACLKILEPPVQNATASSSSSGPAAAAATNLGSKIWPDGCQLLYLILITGSLFFKLGTFKINWAMNRKTVMSRYSGRTKLPGGSKRLGIRWELGKLTVRKVVQVPAKPDDADDAAKPDDPLHAKLRELAKEHNLLKTGQSEFHHLPLLFDAEKLMDHASLAALAAEPLKKTTRTKTKTKKTKKTKADKKAWIGSILKFVETK